MQDDPTPAELTIAVAKFLRRDLLPSLKGYQRMAGICPWWDQTRGKTR